MENFIITNPENPSDFSEIHTLLQTELRKDFKTTYDIEDEYPLVLGESNKQKSYILKLDHQIIAHANFLTKKILDHKTGNKFFISLIGNVCTHNKFQSQGWIRKLFQHLEAQATSLNCIGMWLWSDKKEIYQKLGFIDQGKELRITLSKQSFLPASKTHQENSFTLKQASLDLLKLHDYQKLIKLRPSTRFEIERSIEDYRKLLLIPDTQLLLLVDKYSEIKSFLIIGRGIDFRGVVHEWGAESPAHLNLQLEKLFLEWEIDRLILLAPSEIQYQEYFKILNRQTSLIEKHPCALFKKTTEDYSDKPIFVDEIFVWGMDSI